MKNRIRNIIDRLLKKNNLILIDSSDFNCFKDTKEFHTLFSTLSKLENADLTKTFHALEYSKSQLQQDLFVLNFLGFKENGYFVEFGATNGVDLSNTWLLEKKFSWQGIVAEPAHIWHENLKKNRSCCIETNCVWSVTGETLEFNETTDNEFSTIAEYSGSDCHKTLRNQGVKYPVKTISLNDLLEKYHAPFDIDYLSIDTEGSEYNILKSFSFEKYKIKVITVEHNHTDARKKLYDLLSKNRYKRLFEDLSQWDDWYVLEEEF